MNVNTHGYSDGEYGKWKLVDVASPKIIDGGDPNSNTFVLYSHPRSESGGIRLQIAYARIQNRSGNVASVGFGARIPKLLWKAGLWTHATTTWTNDTTDFQDAGATDAALETTTINDGFLVSSPIIFNGLAINVATASVGTPARTLEYSTGTSTWTTITNAVSFSSASANYVVNENAIVWAPPTDWVPMAGGHGTGVTVGEYGLRVRATTAPTTAGVATTMSVHRLHFLLSGLADSNLYEIPLGGMYAPLETNGEALVAFCSIAASQNMVAALVRARG